MAIHLLRNAMQAVNPLRADERIARWLACQCRLPVDEAAELRLSQEGKKAERGNGMEWIAGGAEEEKHLRECQRPDKRRTRKA